MDFYLGAHMPNWLPLASMPLMVSRRRLMARKTFPRARQGWFLDSGGFTELDLHGGWSLPARQYVDEVRRYRDEIGSMAHASPQDWMCEPWIVRKTGLSVAEHQRRTIENFLELRTLAPEIPWVPVLQGWRLADYLDHLEQYAAAGIHLALWPLVGVGSVCRRQSTEEAAIILGALKAQGLRLHGFGFKTQGLLRCSSLLASSDSMAWSMDARRSAPLPGCTHQNCANCLTWAEQWHTRLLATISRHRGAQLALPFGEAEAASAPIGAVLPRCNGCGARSLDWWGLDRAEIGQALALLRHSLCPLCTAPLQPEMAAGWRETALAA